jgi:hypothetical protein
LFQNVRESLEAVVLLQIDGGGIFILLLKEVAIDPDMATRVPSGDGFPRRRARGFSIRIHDTVSLGRFD